MNKKKMLKYQSTVSSKKFKAFPTGTYSEGPPEPRKIIVNIFKIFKTIL